MASQFTKQDWIRAARLALLNGGVEDVRVEKLARALEVSKGSFYWHFADRGELLEDLLAEWEQEADLLISALGASGDRGLAWLMDRLRENVFASERGEVPSDAAIFAWAATSPSVNARVIVAEEERIALLATLLGSRESAELAYMAYLGFILRRRRGSNPAQAFDLVDRLFRSLGEAKCPPLQRKARQGEQSEPG